MAGSLNKVMIIGRLGQDPELKYTQNGQAVVNLRLATDEGYRDKNTGERVDRTEWHSVVVYGRQAEIVANYLSKGRLAYAEGKLRTRKWQDRDGRDRWTTEVVADRVQFLDSKGSGDFDGPRGQQGGYQGGQQGGRGQQRQPQQVNQHQQPYAQGPSDMPEEDLGPAFPSEAGGMDDVPF
jgi:single-strand DNA-binding protein